MLNPTQKHVTDHSLIRIYTVYHMFWFLTEILIGNHGSDQIQRLKSPLQKPRDERIICWLESATLHPTSLSLHIILIKLSLWYFLFNFLQSFTCKWFSFNNYVSFRYTQLSLGNKVETFFGKDLPLAICSFCGYLFVFPFDVENLV